MRNTKVVNKNGFTILEVMVALAIVGISIGIFFGLIGNSSRLRGKIDEHTKFLLLARTKTEEAFLGIVGKKYKKLNEEKTFEGTTKDGIPWKISQVDKYKEAKKKNKTNTPNENEDENDLELPPKGTTTLSTQVEGININTILFTEESEADENGSEESKVEENGGGKSQKESDD